MKSSFCSSYLSYSCNCIKTDMNNIVLNKIAKKYNGKAVLKDFSVVVKAGSTTCIVGPSGCGKTTLLNIIAGLTNPDSGIISGVPKRISCVFQEDRLLSGFSVLRNLQFVIGNTVSQNSLMNILDRMELRSDADKNVDELSGGMHRRVAIARSVLYQADLYLMDEPFKGLDQMTKNAVMTLVKEMTAGKTLLFVTHDDREADFFNANMITLDYLQ